MTNQQLQPCPFCASTDLEIEEFEHEHDCHVTFAVLCNRCGASGGGGTTDEAVASWNRRAAEPTAEDEREIPMGSRVRHFWQQWEGEVVAIDTKYEIQKADGSHVFAWHRELEVLPENRRAE
jgi:Lar family restriction alleviation protein